MLLLVVLAPIDKVFKQVVNDQPKTQGAACGVIISTCCVCISCCVPVTMTPIRLCSRANAWHAHRTEKNVHASTPQLLIHNRHIHTRHLTCPTIKRHPRPTGSRLQCTPKGKHKISSSTVLRGKKSKGGGGDVKHLLDPTVFTPHNL